MSCFMTWECYKKKKEAGDLVNVRSHGQRDGVDWLMYW